MPPCAAPEWLRTGCILLTMATSAPRSAASTAARMPAKPPPMTMTSCLITETFPGSGALLLYTTPVWRGPTTLVVEPVAPRSGLRRDGALADEETVGVLAALFGVVE